MIGDWNYLQDFLALAREGTLAQAGNARGVDPSTVYRRLHALERALGSSLVERRGRGYVLTPNGESLLMHASSVEEQVFALERAMVGRDRALTGVIRVTTTDTLAQRLLGPYMASFHARFPKIRVDLALDDRVFRLGRGEADVALRPGTRPNEGDVIARPLAEFHSALYASSDYLGRAGRPTRRADLSRHRLVDLDETLAHVAYAGFITRFAPSANVVFRSSSMLGQAMAVINGLGIGVVPCFLMDGQPGVERLFGLEKSLGSWLWLLVHRELRQMARVRAFADFMAEVVESERSLLEGRLDASAKSSAQD